MSYAARSNEQDPQHETNANTMEDDLQESKRGGHSKEIRYAKRNSSNKPASTMIVDEQDDRAKQAKEEARGTKLNGFDGV